MGLVKFGDLKLPAGAVNARVGAVAGCEREDRDDHEKGEESGHEHSVLCRDYQHKS
jgi:hypothetical protein